jgi:hypothetical protein
MAADATAAYIKARAEGKDAAILCDTWEVADAEGGEHLSAYQRCC